MASQMTPKATACRMKILESLALAPEGWTENDFDDRTWTETTMPMSWHLNHTALFRAPFEIKDTNAVKALRLRQWAFRQEDMQVFINGELVAKITPSGSGGKEIEVPLSDDARQAPQEWPQYAGRDLQEHLALGPLFCTQ